jgi:hypothetical protein
MKIHFSMGLLYGRAGRLTAENGGSRPARAVTAENAIACVAVRHFNL